jgi:hypothetical protein
MAADRVRDRTRIIVVAVCRSAEESDSSGKRPGYPFVR